MKNLVNLRAVLCAAAALTLVGMCANDSATSTGRETVVTVDTRPDSGSVAMVVRADNRARPTTTARSSRSGRECWRISSPRPWSPGTARPTAVCPA